MLIDEQSLKEQQEHEKRVQEEYLKQMDIVSSQLSEEHKEPIVVLEEPVMVKEESENLEFNALKLSGEGSQVESSREESPDNKVLEKW